MALLEPEERARIKGLIINKFRGDVEILRPGLVPLEQKTGIPVMGWCPICGLKLTTKTRWPHALARTEARKPLDVAVIRLPRISNFTDFSPWNSTRCWGCGM